MAEAKKPVKKAAVTKKPVVKTTTKVVKKESILKKTAAEKDVKPVVEEIAETVPSVEIVAQETEVIEAEETKTTKAGKRSVKGLKEAEQKQAKEERKAHAAEESSPEAKPVKQAPKARPHHERAGKKFREAYKLIDKEKEYTLAEAIELATKTSPTKFDASVELHVRLNVDPRQADQNIRGQLVLPAGSGKTVRVAVFGDAEDVAAAKKAGADIAGADDFLAQLDKGKIDFDVLVSTPQVMAKLGKYARILGPKGLMPNPKSGTVTKDVAKAVHEAKAGRVEYRVDPAGIVHLAMGKVSFGPAKLGENAAAVAASIKAAKPSSVKATYVKSVFMTTSMGPSIRVLSSEI